MMPPIIYVLNISTLDPEQPGLERWIDASRLKATTRFRFKVDRARCIGAGLLLAHAIRYIHPAYSQPPQISQGPSGKPFLPDLPDFHFNLAHAGKWAVCAIADHPVGIDIEQLPHMADVIGVARQCFTQEEQHHLFALPEAEQSSAFCKLWTLKESYMKATGLGFQLPPQELEIQFGSPITLRHNGIAVSCKLTIHPFNDPDYRIALARIPDKPVIEDEIIKTCIISWSQEGTFIET